MVAKAAFEGALHTVAFQLLALQASLASVSRGSRETMLIHGAHAWSVSSLLELLLKMTTGRLGVTAPASSLEQSLMQQLLQQYTTS